MGILERPESKFRNETFLALDVLEFQFVDITSTAGEQTHTLEF